MTKKGSGLYHVNAQGESARCEAPTPDKCRAKMPDGTPSQHWETMSEACMEGNRQLVKKYGPLGMATGRRAEQNSNILQDAFKKLDTVLTFEEMDSSKGKALRAQGKNLTYTIRTVGNGRALVHYSKDGVDVRPSSFHENTDEARTAVATFEQGS